MFKPARPSRGGIGGVCRDCVRLQNKRWKKKNSKRIKPKRQAYYKTKGRQLEEVRIKLRWQNNPLFERAKMLEKRARLGAREENAPYDRRLNVDLFETWLVEQPFCPCCHKQWKLEPGLAPGQKGAKWLERNRTPSLDRIVPTNGYVLENIAVICWRCNNLKRDATLDELERIVKWMRSTGAWAATTKSAKPAKRIRIWH